MKDSKLAIGLILVSVLSFGFFIKKYHQKTIVKTETKALVAFNTNLLPLYIQKIGLTEKILKKINIKNENINSIALHSKTWTANTKQQVNEIEELMSYFDQHVSGYWSEIQNDMDQKASLKSDLQAVMLLDQEINKYKSK